MLESETHQPRIPGMRDGLRVIITAGAAGIGRVMAESFMVNGGRVVVSDLNAKAVADFNKAHPDHLALQANAGSEDDAEAFMSQALAHLGGLDVLINNAGASGPFSPLEEMDSDGWRLTTAVNLDGTFYHTKRAIPALRKAAAEHGEAFIINISSIAGRLAYPNHSPYSATKWGIVGLTQTLSLELGRAGIRVNAIQPGIVAGPRIDNVARSRAKELGISEEEAMAQALHNVGLGRTVTAQDIANMALVLCSPLGHNIAGQAISVCGHVYAI